jgi:hypothetical protein
MVRPLEDIHQRGGTPIFTTTIITTTATIMAITATIITATAITATERSFDAASTGGLLLWRLLIEAKRISNEIVLPRGRGSRS